MLQSIEHKPERFMGVSREDSWCTISGRHVSGRTAVCEWTQSTYTEVASALTGGAWPGASDYSRCSSEPSYETGLSVAGTDLDIRSFTMETQ